MGVGGSAAAGARGSRHRLRLQPGVTVKIIWGTAGSRPKAQKAGESEACRETGHFPWSDGPHLAGRGCWRDALQPWLGAPSAGSSRVGGSQAARLWCCPLALQELRPSLPSSLVTQVKSLPILDLSVPICKLGTTAESASSQESWFRGEKRAGCGSGQALHPLPGL